MGMPFVQTGVLLRQDGAMSVASNVCWIIYYRACRGSPCYSKCVGAWKRGGRGMIVKKCRRGGMVLQKSMGGG